MTETKRKAAKGAESPTATAATAQTDHGNDHSTHEDLMAQAVLAQFLATGKVRKGWVIRRRKAERVQKRKAA